MPDGNKVVAVPGVGTIAFPASMADSDINNEIEFYMMKTGKGMTQAAANQANQAQVNSILPKQGYTGNPANPASEPGAYQSKGGGPILNVNKSPLQTGLESFESSFGVKPEHMGQNASASPMPFASDLIKGFGHSAISLATKPLETLNEYGNQLGSAASAVSNYIMPKGNAVRDPRAAAAGAGTLAAGGVQALAGEKAGEAIKGIPSEVKSDLAETLDVGKAKQKFMADRAEHAGRVYNHVADVEAKVHADVKQAIAGVASKVDEAHPEGVFDKNELSEDVRGAFREIVKTNPDKVPAALSDLVQKQKSSARALTTQELSAATMLKQEMARGMSEADIRSAASNLGFAPKQVDAIMSSMGVAGPTRGMTFAELAEIRSNLGRQLNAKGAAGAAANKVYGLLSDKLRAAAKSEDLEPDWLDANAKYKDYMNDFHRSPLKKVLTGKAPTGDILPNRVMSAFSDENAPITQKIMQKYEGYGTNPAAMAEEAKRAAYQQATGRLVRPTKWDVALAGFSPKMAALRLGLPRLLRSGKLTDWVAGEGLPEIKPKDVQVQK